MQDDDEILGDYEREFEGAKPPRRRTNRGFWVVAVAMLLGCILLVIEIFANRPLVSSIGHAQSDLKAARSLALGVQAETGTFDGAGASGLSAADPTRRYTGPDESSTGLGSVSVFASGTTWAAAVEVRPDACLYISEQVGSATRYGGATVCTGRAALSADQDAW
jgi:hypothetical protein